MTQTQQQRSPLKTSEEEFEQNPVQKPDQPQQKVIEDKQNDVSQNFQAQTQKIQRKNEQQQVTQKSSQSSEQRQRAISRLTVIKQLQKMNDLVMFDISVKKGRKQKFINHMDNIQKLQKLFQTHIEKFSSQERSQIYQKFSTIYYNLARLGENQIALETAILLLEVSQSCRFLVVRWRMQLAAMKSSSNHKGSYKVAFQTMKIIIEIIQDLSEKLASSKPKLSSYLKLVIKIINSQQKNDFTWIHNYENNIKSFTDHIRQLIFSEMDMRQQPQKAQQSFSNIKVQPFYPGYDFQIADYMSLQKLEFDYIKKLNQLADIKQISKQLVIFASICCFTQATQTYYLGDYSLKYLHFKAIEIALITVDRQCTYIGFLFKILNDYYGTKMAQIRQENSELMEINELKRRIPRDKRERPMKNLCLAE